MGSCAEQRSVLLHTPDSRRRNGGAAICVLRKRGHDCDSIACCAGQAATASAHWIVQQPSLPA